MNEPANESKVDFSIIQFASVRGKTQIARAGYRRITVVLEKKWLDAVSKDLDSRVVVGVDRNTRDVWVFPESITSSSGCKVIRNRNGTGRMSKTISAEAFDLIFPDGSKSVLVPNEVAICECKEVQVLRLRLGCLNQGEGSNSDLTTTQQIEAVEEKFETSIQPETFTNLDSGHVSANE